MLLTSISKLKSSIRSSIYMSCTFQLNDGFSKAGPQCLCLCGSHRLAVTAGQGPRSVSFSTIIIVVTAWMATWLSVAWIFCHFRIVSFF